MFKRFAASAGSLLLGTLFGALGLFKLVLDYAGRADIVTSLSSSDGVIGKLLSFALKLPWEFSGLCFAAVVFSWIFFTYKILLAAPPSVVAKADDGPPKLNWINDGRIVRPTETSDHGINAEDLVLKTKPHDVAQKIAVLDDLMIIFNEHLTSVVSDGNYVGSREVGRHTDRLERLTKFSADMKTCSEHLERIKGRIEQFRDIHVIATIWGLPQVMQAASVYSEGLTKLGQTPDPNQKLSADDDERLNFENSLRRLAQWKVETSENMRVLKQALRQKLLRIS